MPQIYPDLPCPETDAGDPRRTGVEIEFAGMDETRAAEVVAEVLGGTAHNKDTHELIVEGSDLGDIGVELDTVLRKKKDIPFLEAGLSLATGLVPVEIITPPLTRAGVASLDRLVQALRDAGATGTSDGVLLGFGVHLNPEVVAPDHPHTLATILAFGLLESWLRREADLDMTRRLMPYVNPWPTAFVTGMVTERPDTLADLMDIMAPHVQSRNHGLDLFPLFAHAHPDLYKDRFPRPDKTSARPTFHFRMPDCRIDEPGWSLARAWGFWVLVERVAFNAPLLNALRAEWLDHAHNAPGAERRWCAKVKRLLDHHDEALISEAAE